ncbi:MAG: radical SAM protein, partial [Desulfobacterales bacterium]|nr:radical SAM protein [Desulfobacterales bacterium]
LIRTTRGCPWNRCEFCTLFKEMTFSMRSVEEIKSDILAAREYYGGHPFETCFLQDGDSFTMKTADLIEVLTCLKDAFPSLKQISSYGRARTMARKSPQAMADIRAAGLNKLYCGMESGSDAVLKQMKKGITREMIIQAGTLAREAGMETTEFIILGLGGTALSEIHARETAEVLNAVNPDQIRVLTIGVKPGTGLYDQLQSGAFTLPSEAAIIREQRQLVEALDGITSHYANHHSVDLLLEIRGQLPHAKADILAVLDRFLALGEREQTHFVLGRRLGYYHRLDQMSDPHRYAMVESQMDKLENESPEALENLFHRIRSQMI